MNVFFLTDHRNNRHKLMRFTLSMGKMMKSVKIQRDLCYQWGNESFSKIFDKSECIHGKTD